MWSILFNVLTVNRHTYVAETERQCIRRMREHGAPQNVLNNLNNERLNEDEEEHAVRRSARIRHKVVTSRTTTYINNNNDYNEKNKNVLSSIMQHEKTTGHHMN